MENHDIVAVATFTPTTNRVNSFGPQIGSSVRPMYNKPHAALTRRQRHFVISARQQRPRTREHRVRR